MKNIKKFIMIMSFWVSTVMMANAHAVLFGDTFVDEEGKVCQITGSFIKVMVCNEDSTKTVINEKH